MKSIKIFPPIILFHFLLLSAFGQQSPQMQRLFMKDHWEYYRQMQNQRNREQASQATTSSGSNFSGTLLSGGNSKPYKYSKKELESMQRESEQKAEAGNLQEIYRCIAYYEYKEDVSRVQYWTEKACERGDKFYCLDRAYQSRYSAPDFYKWLNKAYALGEQKVFNIIVDLATELDPERALQMMKNQAATEPAYYFKAARERFCRGKAIYDSAKGMELLKAGAMKGDSSCSYWLKALLNPATAKLAAITLGMRITEENSNGNWIIARQYPYVTDIIYSIDGEQRYASKGVLYSVSNTLFVEGYKYMIDINGKLVRQTNYDRIDRPQGGYIPFKKNGFQGFMDSLGNEVIPAEYYYATIEKNGRVQMSDGITLKNRSGNQETAGGMLTWAFQKNLNPSAADYFSNNQLPAFRLIIVKTVTQDPYKKKKGPDKYIVTPKGNISDWEPGQPIGIMDAQGKWVVPLVSIPASTLYVSSDNYFVFEKNGKLGVYSDDGDLWLNAEFDYVSNYDFMAKTFIVHKDFKAGLYRIGGEKILDCAYTSIERSVKTIKEKSVSGWTYENNQVKGFINDKGKILMEEKK